MNEDGSAPARKRLRTINIDAFNIPIVEVRREDRTPDVDWTGFKYKAPADCTVDMNREPGRESSTRARVERVKPGRIYGA